MTSTREIKRPRGFHFDNLSVLEKLEIAAHDEGFRRIARSLPQIGNSGKGRPSVTDTAGMLLIGMLTCLYGSDRRADAEIRSGWQEVSRIFRDARIPCPLEPFTAQNFRDFRKGFVARQGGLVAWNARVREIAREEAVRRAVDMGLLGGHPWSAADGGWEGIPRERTICGDATVFKATKPSAQVIADAQEAVEGKRGATPWYGNPGDGTDIDRIGKLWGYSHVLLTVSGPGVRQTQLLDIVRARTADGAAVDEEDGEECKAYEMTAVLDAARGLQALIRDTDVGLVYDGALRGEHSIDLRGRLGWFTLNRARGTCRSSHLLAPGTPIGDRVKRVGIAFPLEDGTECTQRFAIHAGTFWRIGKTSIGRDTYAAHVDHEDLVRVRNADGTYHWKFIIETYCARHEDTHRVEVDANGRIDGKCVADAIRPVPQFRDANWEINGRRNSIEAFNCYIKHYMMRGGRARTFNSQAHEFDLRLTGQVINAITWAEHGASSPYTNYNSAEYKRSLKGAA